MTKIIPQSVGMGDGFILVSDQNGTLFSWGKNDEHQLGLMTDEDEYFSDFETTPKEVEIFQQFDVRTVHAGDKFAIITLKEKE